jgi:phage terminase small subunit
MSPRQRWAQPRELRPLNVRQQRFVEHYLVLGNGREAALRAGYSSRNAATIAVHLKRLPYVARAISEARARQAGDARIDAACVIAELARLAFSDIGRIAEWDADGIALKSNAEIAPEDRAAIHEISLASGKSGRATRIRLHHKQRALDGLAKHLGLYGRGIPRAADPQQREAAAELTRAIIRQRLDGLAAAAKADVDKA